MPVQPRGVESWQSALMTRRFECGGEETDKVEIAGRSCRVFDPQERLMLVCSECGGQLLGYISSPEADTITEMDDVNYCPSQAHKTLPAVE